MDELDHIRQTFSANIESVDKLINFDREVQDYAIKTVEELHQRLKVSDKLDNPRLNAERTLEVLKRIRANDSLRPRYQTIFNQAVVLLVSYFGSAVADIFRLAVARALESSAKDIRLLREELKLSLENIRDSGQNILETVPDIFIQQKDISFQDMQSIHRAFEEYLRISIERNNDVNNIIVGMACRHAIAHRGSRADNRLVRQISKALPRDLKPDLQDGDAITFNPNEIQSVSECMLRYVDKLCAKIRIWTQELDAPI